MMKPIMKSKLSVFVIPSLLLCTPPQALGQADPVSCDEKTVVASAVRTTEDVQAFVQCAYEFVQDVGFAEAYRAMFLSVKSTARGSSPSTNAGEAAQSMFLSPR